MFGRPTYKHSLDSNLLKPLEQEISEVNLPIGKAKNQNHLRLSLALGPILAVRAEMGLRLGLGHGAGLERVVLVRWSVVVERERVRQIMWKGGLTDD